MEFYGGYMTDYDKKFKLKSSQLGTTTNPFGANQLEELGKKLNIGVQNVEVGTLKMKDFETVPTTHFEEMRRLAKFTGTNLSFHAPIEDPAGFDEKHFSEEKRKSMEAQLASVLDRAALLKKEDGLDVPVTLHASGAFARQFERGLKEDAGSYEEDGKIKQRLKDAGTMGMRTLGIVNQETGEIQHIQHQEKYRLGMDEKEVWDVKKGLNGLNVNKWHDDQLGLFSLQHDIAEREKKMQEATEEMLFLQQKNDALEKTGLVSEEQYKKNKFENEEKIKMLHFDAQNLMNQVDRMDVKLHSQISDMAHKFRSYGNSESKKQFDKFYSEFSDLEKEKRKILDETNYELGKDNISDEEKKKLRYLFQEKFVRLRSEERKRLTSGLAQIEDAPKIWRPITEFALDKTAETVANSLLRAYSKHGDNTPFISLENAWTETGFSRAEELRELIDKSRAVLVKKLIEKEHMKEDDAKKLSEKLIGATWDVGHIFGLRKAGYEEKELKDLVLEEAEKIAKGGRHVKHIHLTDNFGFEDSHLPPGMGNVPIKEILEKMEKEGVLKNARAIEESGGFINAFKKESFPFAMTELGTPMYASGPLYEMDLMSPYRTTHIDLPQKHFDLYGSSFSTLPTSVGGQVGEGSSRFTGRPNQ